MKPRVLPLLAAVLWIGIYPAATTTATNLPTVDEIRQIKKTFALLDEWEMSCLAATDDTHTDTDAERRYLNDVVFDSPEMSDWSPYTKSRLLYEYTPNYDKTAVVLQTWDGSSISWQNTYRQLTTYLPNGNLNTSLLQTWNTDDLNWLGIADETRSYNATDNLETVTQRTLNVATDQFQNTERQLYNYNEKGFLTRIVWQTADPKQANKWYNNIQYSYAYDKAGNESLTIQQDWNNEQQMWSDARRSMLDYTQQQDVETIVAQHNKNGKWDNAHRELKSYDNDGYLLTTAQQVWNDQHQMWQSLSLEKRTYDIQSRLAQTTQLLWDSENQSWVNISQQSYVYDQNYLKVIISYYWNEVDRAWDTDSKSIFTYQIPISATQVQQQQPSSIIRSTPKETSSNSSNMPLSATNK